MTTVSSQQQLLKQQCRSALIDFLCFHFPGVGVWETCMTPNCECLIIITAFWCICSRCPPIPPTRTFVVFARVVVNFSPPPPHVAARNKRSTRQHTARQQRPQSPTERAKTSADCKCAHHLVIDLSHHEWQCACVQAFGPRKRACVPLRELSARSATPVRGDARVCEAGIHAGASRHAIRRDQKTFGGQNAGALR